MIKAFMPVAITGLALPLSPTTVWRVRMQIRHASLSAHIGPCEPLNWTADCLQSCSLGCKISNNLRKQGRKGAHQCGAHSAC